MEEVNGLIMIPQNLDAPPRFLFWPCEDACMLLIPIFFGLAAGYMLCGLLIAIVALVVMRKLKKGRDFGFLMSVYYWYFPFSRRIWKGSAPSHVREFFG